MFSFFEWFVHVLWCDLIVWSDEPRQNQGRVLVDSAVFTLAINRLHSFKRQPCWFHNLNSMDPVKGIDLFNLVFLVISLFLFILLL